MLEGISSCTLLVYFRADIVVRDNNSRQGMLFGAEDLFTCHMSHVQHKRPTFAAPLFKEFFFCFADSPMHLRGHRVKPFSGFCAPSCTFHIPFADMLATLHLCAACPAILQVASDSVPLGIARPLSANCRGPLFPIRAGMHVYQNTIADVETLPRPATGLNTNLVLFCHAFPYPSPLVGTYLCASFHHGSRQR